MNEICVGIRGLSFTVPRGDDRIIELTVRDRQGDLVDISDVQDIEYSAWDSEGDAGGVPVVNYTLSGGDISIHGNMSTFSFKFNKTDSDLFADNFSFHRCRITYADGDIETIFTGLLRTPNNY